jgi:hypothetical protein
MLSTVGYLKFVFYEIECTIKSVCLAICGRPITVKGKVKVKVCL